MKHSSKIMTRIAGGLIVAGFLAASRAGAADTSISTKGAEFIKEASAGNQAEIANAKLAQQKSENSDVKDLAQMIQTDHQQAQDKLQSIAQAHGVALEATTSRTERRTESKLAKLTGADFDQQFTKDMLEGHVATIKKYQKAAGEVEDADLKQYIQETLPKLQAHLQHSEVAARAVGVDQSTITSITKELPAGGVGGTGENQEHGAGKSQPY